MLVSKAYTVFVPKGFSVLANAMLLSLHSWWWWPW